MKGILHKLLKSLNFSGRDWAVLLLALLLAFSTWLLHNLSLRYNDYLSVSVVAHCNIDGHSAVSANRCEVMARCRTTGYNVIKSDMKGRWKVLDIDFKPSEMKHKEGDTFYVTSADLQEYAHVFYGDDVTVEYFVSDTLFFRFPYENCRKVPVYPVYSLSYAPQYTNVGNVEVEPDSVTVYGEPFHLENIERVYTVPVKHSNLSEDVQGVVALEKVKGVRFSRQDVHYSIDVARYVEVRATLPVGTVNVPPDKDLLVLPSSVNVTLKCTFPLAGDPFEGLSLAVDYVDYISSLSGKCAVRVQNLPRGVIDCEIEPFMVGCVVEDR